MPESSLKCTCIFLLHTLPMGAARRYTTVFDGSAPRVRATTCASTCSVNTLATSWTACPRHLSGEFLHHGRPRLRGSCRVVDCRDGGEDVAALSPYHSACGREVLRPSVSEVRTDVPTGHAVGAEARERAREKIRDTAGAPAELRMAAELGEEWIDVLLDDEEPLPADLLLAIRAALQGPARGAATGATKGFQDAFDITIPRRVKTEDINRYLELAFGNTFEPLPEAAEGKVRCSAHGKRPMRAATRAETSAGTRAETAARNAAGAATTRRAETRRSPGDETKGAAEAGATAGTASPRQGTANRGGGYEPQRIPPRTCPAMARASAAAPTLAAADRRRGVAARATTAASMRPAARVEPDAARAPVAAAGAARAADAGVLEPVEEGAAEV